MTLTLLKNIDQLFCRMSPNLHMFNIFLWLEWGHSFLARIPQNDICILLSASYLRVHDVDILLLVPTRFLHCEITIFSFIVDRYLEEATLRLCKSCLCSNNCLQILVSFGGSCLQYLLLQCLPNGDFLFLSLFLPLIGILWGRAVSSALLIYLIIYVYKYFSRKINFILWLKFNTIIIYFVAQIGLGLAMGVSSGWILCSFDKLPLLSIYLLSVPQDIPALCCIFSASSRIKHFSRKTELLILKNTN